MTAAAVIPVLDSWAGRTRVHRYFVCDVYTSQPLAVTSPAYSLTAGRSGPDEMQRLARHGPSAKGRRSAGHPCCMRLPVGSCRTESNRSRSAALR
jgi:hypothetical protein